MTTPFDPGRTCAKCPAFLRADKSIPKFKKSTGAPMCGRYGHVLGKPGSTPVQEQKIQTHFANQCPSYMDELPTLPLEYQMKVAMPDVDIITAEPDDELHQSCRSCGTCKNLIPDTTVQSEMGWEVGLCAAKGKLILPNRWVMEAKGCAYREFGQQRRSTAGIHLLPEFEDAFQLSTNPIKSYFESKGNFVEPGEWETERPVSDEDRSSGIKAWRRIVDPAGTGNEAWLPVYDENFFNEEERAKIPRTNSPEHPELYIDHFGGVYLAAVCWTELDETPALWGEAGVGKTELFRHLAWIMCLPYERISITGSTEIDELAGKMHFSKDRGTYFEYGRLPKAWTKPCVIGLDEPNVAKDPSVWHFLRPLTDNSKQLVLDMNEGEQLDRHADCYMGFAMNPAWDPRNVGAEPISDADASRLFHVFIDVPPPELEREIIRNRVKLDGWEIDNERLDMLMNVAELIRGLSKDGTLPITWAIRPQIKVARALRWFDPVTAYRRAVGDFLEPQQTEVLLDQVRAHAAQ